MPEFVLIHGTQEATNHFYDCDEFTQGYVEAMFWTECHADNPELDGAELSELSPESWKEIIEVCQDFQKNNKRDLGYYYKNGRDASHAGYDFWLTRNHHGTGFWDRGSKPFYRRLSNASYPYGSCDVYRGDDEFIYVT